ncbi:hypothetical protein [Aurantiacibacter gangjinensis]|uniref:hypothetical protein n=1 Tax=Aurantiacibacter gangjinensis TaxID=502682 RepID=UPI0012E069CC|nr:hypothetical protein [Aurantiacibacter gangjinensis]
MKGWVRAMLRKRLIVLLVAVVAVFAGIAWYDGGQEEQRLITQPVEIPESYS